MIHRFYTDPASAGGHFRLGDIFHQSASRRKGFLTRGSPNSSVQSIETGLARAGPEPRIFIFISSGAQNYGKVTDKD
jgi:hypothetical protein